MPRVSRTQQIVKNSATTHMMVKKRKVGQREATVMPGRRGAVVGDIAKSAKSEMKMLNVQFVAPASARPLARLARRAGGEGGQL